MLMQCNVNSAQYIDPRLPSRDTATILTAAGYVDKMATKPPINPGPGPYISDRTKIEATQARTSPAPDPGPDPAPGSGLRM